MNSVVEKKEKALCRNCGSELIKKATQKKPSQLKQPYYYTAFYYCPTCKKLYHNEKFRVVNPNFQQVLFTDHVKKEAFDVEIWTDGACVNNGFEHAKAAWAFVANSAGSGQAADYEEAGLVHGKQTNNVAEGMAILRALQWAAKKGYKKIKIYSDSQISINNMHKGAAKVKMNAEIFHESEKVIKENKLDVVFEKVLGHSGDINNERADQLANGLASR